ncbi:GroES-like protein [Punctularia strigosozonata HHB-11173 SS5]|uniref:GroES-like protein n=1 Tax=Punctularia strigosozonata (strain HHB-11173) TaxID=741275 RepID=UPI00044178B4|nr:GroES-like protein [Punctularia strigosozonata HHB-11173 SS5]EIN07976.1 GroES-like protein [Punctularia strigosozonata HHB-11173 SS5]
MSSKIPSTMRAVVSAEGKSVTVKEVPVPKLGEGEILVKVAAVAQNPTDWKHAEFVPPGRILGVDFAGTIVQVGPGVQGWQIGERVAGFEHGGQWEDRGSFAEYLKAQAGLVWKIPEGTSFEEASTMNCGLWTAIQALYHPTRLGLVGHPDTVPGPDAPWVLIYSGATSVGQYAIQLAHASGYRVVTTASATNFEYVKSLGADAAVDYNHPDAADKIKEITGDSLSFGLDTFSTAQTQETAVKAFGSKGGKLIVILPPQESARALRPDVEIKGTLLYTVLGRAFARPNGVETPAAPEDRDHMSSWMPKITEMVGSGKIKANPVKIWPGGLDAIKDGFEYMKAGKVRAEKIVYQIL